MLHCPEWVAHRITQACLSLSAVLILIVIALVATFVPMWADPNWSGMSIAQIVIAVVCIGFSIAGICAVIKNLDDLVKGFSQIARNPKRPAPTRKIG